jgi:carbonic anhydrase
LTAIEQLIAGYHRFRSGYYEENRERLLDLAHAGQSPKIAVIACCDSRVDPAVITDSRPGSLFVIRNVANLVPPCEGEGLWHSTSAALEFAVCSLEVEHVIVLGHARCGGIRSLLEVQDDGHEDMFIADWMSIADSARKRTIERTDLVTLEEQIYACELDAIKISLGNLGTFPWIAERLAADALQLQGWYYDMATGDLLCLDAEGQDFVRPAPTEKV